MKKNTTSSQKAKRPKKRVLVGLTDSQREMLKTLFTEPDKEASFTSSEKLWRAAVKQDKTLKREQVDEYLKELRGHYLHAPLKKKFPRRRVTAATFNEILGMDLADFVQHKNANENLRYMLVGVDLFSRKAYAQMMPDKTCASTIKAFQKMFPGKKIPYRSIWSDMGGEFNCKEFKDYLKRKGLKIYFATNFAKVSIAERFIRTLRMKIKRFMSQMHTENYIDSLQDIIASYNKTFHRSIGTSPDSVSAENSDQVFQVLHPPNFRKRNSMRPYKFNVGDLVRVSDLYKGATTKESQHRNWTEEIFRIISRKRPDTVIPIYVLADLKGGEDGKIQGTWYEEELRPALNLDKNKFLDPKWKITERKEGRQRLYNVKFEGWPEKFNEDVTLKELNEVRKRSQTPFSSVKTKRK